MHAARKGRYNSACERMRIESKPLANENHFQYFQWKLSFTRSPLFVAPVLSEYIWIVQPMQTNASRIAKAKAGNRFDPILSIRAETNAPSNDVCGGVVVW